MAKDDYDVIVFKILLYYYAVLKRKIVFEKTSLKYTVTDSDNPMNIMCGTPPTTYK
ncbi:MAG: hypothetical protein Q4E28_01065 [Clostridia bacterium]|nr:hypothetical protein [Clostridia bacterium]